VNEHIEIVEPRRYEPNHKTDVEYFEYTCVECMKLCQNTYCEPHRTDMLSRRLCFHCNYWFDTDAALAKNANTATIIGGHMYSPGNRTSGSFRGMAGRRFDIEYIEPSVYAGQKITTFDLWSGSSLPEALRLKYPDTARFLGGAEKAELQGEITTCWNSSDSKSEPFPLPSSLRRNTTS
jgi:hypothetical protein